MTQTPESGTEFTAAATHPRPNSRLTPIAAWVGIVAGVVFVVAVVFFSGFFTGRYYGGRDGYGPYYHGGPMGPAMMGPGGQYGPGGMMGPGGQWTPGPPSTSTTPTTPRP